MEPLPDRCCQGQREWGACWTEGGSWRRSARDLRRRGRPVFQLVHAPQVQRKRVLLGKNRLHPAGAGDWVEVDGVGARLRKKRGEVQPYDLGCDGCEPGEAALRQTGLRGAVQLRPVRFADQRGVYLPVSGVQVL